MARTAKLTGPWGETIKRLSAVDKLVEQNVSNALRVSAKELVKDMKAKIRRGDIGWEPLSPITKHRKGHDSPLFDSGSLKESLKAHRVGRLHYDIGIPTSAKNKFGASLVMVGAVQEFGKVIVPKEAGSLAIPLNTMASELQHKNKGVRNIPGIFRLKDRNLLAIRDGSGIKLLFVLLKKVTIPPRSFIVSTYINSKDRIIKRIWYAQKMALAGRSYAPRVI